MSMFRVGGTDAESVGETSIDEPSALSVGPPLRVSPPNSPDEGAVLSPVGLAEVVSSGAGTSLIDRVGDPRRVVRPIAVVTVTLVVGASILLTLQSRLSLDPLELTNRTPDSGRAIGEFDVAAPSVGGSAIDAASSEGTSGLTAESVDDLAAAPLSPTTPPTASSNAASPTISPNTAAPTTGAATSAPSSSATSAPTTAAFSPSATEAKATTPTSATTTTPTSTTTTTTTTTTTAGPPVNPTGRFQLISVATDKCASGQADEIDQQPCGYDSNQAFQFEAVGRHVRIVETVTGRVLDVDGESTADGALIVPWPWHGGLNQRWFVQPVGTSYEIVSVKSGKCIMVKGGMASAGTQLVQQSCDGSAPQLWQLR